MKKFLALIFAMILLGGSAAAETPDLSGLTTDELLSVIREAQALLFDQQLIDGVKVPAGTYTVGQDIPAGVYRIKFIGGEYASGRLLVYNADGTIDVMHFVGEAESVPEIGKIELTDGQQVELLYITSMFFAYTGLFH